MQLYHNGLKKLPSDHSLFFASCSPKTNNRIYKKNPIINKQTIVMKLYFIYLVLSFQIFHSLPFPFYCVIITQTVILGTTGWNSWQMNKCLKIETHDKQPNFMTWISNFINCRAIFKSSWKFRLLVFWIGCSIRWWAK